jgi:hypothetical protein
MGIHINTDNQHESKAELSQEEIEQLKELVRELLNINETQNAQLIAFNAKLQNEEAKVRLAQRYISQLELALTTTQNQA